MARWWQTAGIVAVAVGLGDWAHQGPFSWWAGGAVALGLCLATRFGRRGWALGLIAALVGTIMLRPWGLAGPLAAVTWSLSGTLGGYWWRPSPSGLHPESGALALGTLFALSLWITWRVVGPTATASLSGTELLGLYLATPPLEVAVAGAVLWRSGEGWAWLARWYGRRAPSGRRRWDELASGVGAGLVLSAAAGAVVAVEQRVTGWPIRSNNPLVYAPRLMHQGPVALAVLVVAVVVLAPVAEELVFRGILLEGLRRRWGAGWGAVTASAVFAAAHFDPTLFLALWVTGLGLAALYLSRQSLVPSTIAHATFNGISVALALWAWR
ncbi:MAG: CPBP family intramembrane metalloprotease [Firmicutes bacterium]|nr:CPBP family intramembrane metalloprotease [Alicyclobacillaceae bacterium]MCL6496888.1 CPBP family intramembrane metalloprotease [Bacillota bacterium]